LPCRAVGQLSCDPQHALQPHPSISSLPLQILRLQHTLLLVLLACWRQQEAASPLDITRWALDGHLPYLSFAAAEGAGLTQYRNTLGPDLLVAKGVTEGWRVGHGTFVPSPGLADRLQVRQPLCGEPSFSHCDGFYLPSAGVPTPYYLHTQAAELAAKLGLDCPPISPALWLERYVAQLELPQVLVWAGLGVRMCWQWQGGQPGTAMRGLKG